VLSRVVALPLLGRRRRRASEAPSSFLATVAQAADITSRATAGPVRSSGASWPSKDGTAAFVPWRAGVRLGTAGQVLPLGGFELWLRITRRSSGRQKGCASLPPLISNVRRHMPTVVAFSAIAVVVFLFLRWQQGSNERHVSSLRAKVEATYKSTVLNASDPRFAFAGSTASVIEDVESFHERDGVAMGYTLTRFARNPAGEYFMFMHGTERERPYVKHVSHEVARVKLKSKYVPP
jgi:hypothetical protein